MSSAAQRLAELSGLSGVSAAEHLKRIAGAAGVAGALLAASSGLATGSAADHLLAERSTAPTVATPAPGGGGSMALWEEEHDHQIRQQILAEDEILIVAVAQMIANGVLT